MKLEKRRAYLKYSGNLYREIGLRGLPEDIRIIDLTWDIKKDLVDILFSHWTLPETEEGLELPIMKCLCDEYGNFIRFSLM